MPAFKTLVKINIRMVKSQLKIEDMTRYNFQKNQLDAQFQKLDLENNCIVN